MAQMTQTSLSDFHEFAAEMDRLKSCYPNHKATRDEFKQQIQEYYKRLRRYPIRCVLRALMQAADASPKWFPTAGVLIGLTKEHLRADATAINADSARDAREAADARDRARYEQIPTSPTLQQEYIDAAGSDPFERQARIWECETRRFGLDPARGTPADLFARRMPELMKLCELMTSGREMPQGPAGARR